MPSNLPSDHQGRTLDFGKTAADYDRYRPGFPPSMFERISELGWLRPGMTAIDLGTGTGSLALGLAARGLDVIGVDPAAELLEVARGRATALGHRVRFVEVYAEDLALPPSSADLVTAGQCWWWFDAPRALAQIQRVLCPGGRLVIANFSYLPRPGSVAERTEGLVLRHNPGWPKAGESGLFEAQIRDLDGSGFADVESFSYVESVPMTHEAWRGRMRACNGVGAALDPAAVDAFDLDLADMLAREFPGPLSIPHRVFVAGGRQVGTGIGA